MMGTASPLPIQEPLDRRWAKRKRAHQLLARNVMALGLSSIQALDLENNRLTPVLEDDRYNYIQPKISGDGYLYDIRRPYEKPSPNPFVVLTDVIFFSFRLIRAVFHYLNFFPWFTATNR